jgi:hypothetical protein
VSISSAQRPTEALTVGEVMRARLAARLWTGFLRGRLALVGSWADGDPRGSAREQGERQAVGISENHASRDLTKEASSE